MSVTGTAEGVQANVARLCASSLDARSLRIDVLAELRRRVPFDAHAWVLTDPETTVGSAPVAAVPSLADLPRLIRLRYGTAVNRWTTLTGDPVALLAEATGGDLFRSRLWRELLRGYGVSDVASMVFRDRYGWWAFLELWRTGGRTFDAVDADLLRRVAPTVTAGLRRAQARTFVHDPTGDRGPAGPLVLLLSPGLDVVRLTPGTAEALRTLVPRDDGGPPVPAGAYNVAAQLLAAEDGVDGHPASARVHLADGRWLVLRAARLEDDRPVPERDVAVTVEDCPPAERLALFGRACGLTTRERDLLDQLAAGRDTREIAERLVLSEHTVQDHLKSVFAKTGTRSRRTLLARGLGG